MRDYQPGDLRPVDGGPKVEVVAPTACRNGHPLGPRQAHIGFTPCDCGQGAGRGHTTWTCRTCNDITIGDGCTKQR